MKGEGYSSKVRVLLPLAQRYFGQQNAQTFRKLSDLYIQSEYTFESISREVALEVIGCAKQILNLYGGGVRKPVFKVLRFSGIMGLKQIRFQLKEKRFAYMSRG